VPHIQNITQEKIHASENAKSTAIVNYKQKLNRSFQAGFDPYPEDLVPM